MADQHHNQQWQQQGYGYPPQSYQQQPPPGQQSQGYGQQPPSQYPHQYGAPPQSYGQPPQNYEPPQGQHQYQRTPPSQYPPQQPYNQPPQNQYQQYGAPPQGYAATQGQNQYQQGPPGQYPPQQPYGAPPRGQYQQHYGAPQQGYGASPPGGHQQPPQAYPQQQYHGPPAPPSLGYDAATQTPPKVDLSREVEAVRKAMKGMGCDEKALIAIFTKISNPWTMQQLIKDYNSRFMRDLHKDIESETRGNFEEACLALLRTPLEQDVRTVQKALVRAGTDEEALNDVVLCRSNADLKIIMAQYKKSQGQDLINVIKDDVGDKLFRLYSMVLRAERAEESAPVLPQDIDRHVTELQRATEGTIGVNSIAVAQIFTSCNNAQIRAIVTEYERKYHRKLEDVIKKEFSGDMEDVLIRMLLNATDKPKADAESIHMPLNKTMRKDTLLINRLIRLYWDKPRLEAAKAAYRKRYNQTLASDIKEETSGDYERLMLGIIGEK